MSKLCQKSRKLDKMAKFVTSFQKLVTQLVTCFSPVYNAITSILLQVTSFITEKIYKVVAQNFLRRHSQKSGCMLKKTCNIVTFGKNDLETPSTTDFHLLQVFQKNL